MISLDANLLLRNPAVVSSPLSPAEAVNVIQLYRHHPSWALFGLDPDSPGLHDDFATANVKDFEGLGFARVWNPLAQGD